MKNVINDAYIEENDTDIANVEEIVANKIGDYDFLINENEDEIDSGLADVEEAETSNKAEVAAKFGAAKHAERRRRTVVKGNNRIDMYKNEFYNTSLGNPRYVGSMKNGTYLNCRHANTARRTKRYHGRADRNKELSFLMRKVENEMDLFESPFQYKFNIEIFSDNLLSEKEFLSGVYSLSDNFADAHKWGIGENFINNIKFVDDKTATAVLTVEDPTTVENIKDVCEYVYATIENVDVCAKLA